jgi:hypothetical protein
MVKINNEGQTPVLKFFLKKSINPNHNHKIKKPSATQINTLLQKEKSIVVHQKELVIIKD